MDAHRRHFSLAFPVSLLALVCVLLALPAGAAAATSLPAGFQETTMVSGLDQPTAVAWTPDGRMLIAEKPGRVRVVSAAGQLAATPVIDISDHVNNYWDRGFLGIAVDASFTSNHYVYLLYTWESNPLNTSAAKSSRLTRITLADDNTTSAETILLGKSTSQPCPTPANTVDCLPSDSPSHSIGTVRSDPADGTLWVGAGDGAGFGAVDTMAFRSYDDAGYNGKILHIDRNGQGLASHPFCPSDADLTHVCSKVHSKGFRNPFRFTLRPGAGPAVGDVGWASWEEFDMLPAAGGKNYGWPCYEANVHTSGYSADTRCTGAGGEYSKEGTAAADVYPVHSYPHNPSCCSIIGGPTYGGTAYPAAYQGSVFFGDYTAGNLSRLVPDGSGGWTASSFGTGWSGVDLEPAPGNGDLVYADLNGNAIRRITYAATTGEVDYAVGRPTTSSSSENGSLGPEKAVDGDPTTRWSSDFLDAQWWQVDLGGTKTIDAVELNWEAAYASQYRVSTSTDGTNFTTVSDEVIAASGLHTTNFAARQVRYVRITGITRATQFGISFWNARVLGPGAGPPPGDLALGRPTSSSSNENTGLGPENAVDGNSTTRWSSDFLDGQWWQVDLGSSQSIDTVELNWEAAYAALYRVSTSTDGTNFTTVSDETISSPGPHTTLFTPRQARYVRITGLTRATQFGISFWDAKVMGSSSPANRPPTAVASGNPTTGSAPLPVAFRGDTSSDPDLDPLTYDWDFGDGSAHSSAANPSHTYAAGSYTAKLTVSDGRGGSDSATVSVTSGNTPPTATITAPVAGSTFRDGVAVSLSGSGQDAEDGALAGSRLEWHVIGHHSTHTHDLGKFPGATASFTPLTDHDADTWYEIILTATDSAGATGSKNVRIDPETVAFTITSAPSGVPVSYAGTNQVTPFSTRSTVGFKTSISTADPFIAGTTTWLFDRWSDGGTRLHNITIPATDSTVTASYLEDKAAGKVTSASSIEGTGFEPGKAVDNSSTTRWSSSFTNNQWWQVDLGRARLVTTMSLNWEAAYASQYQIRTSTNGTTFTTAATVNITAPGWKTTTFTSRSARYVRVVGVTRATQFGISFWDARVQGPAD
jgi:glucose/arabinose dehydrogenase/PKD repeat protein